MLTMKMGIRFGMPFQSMIVTGMQLNSITVGQPMAVRLFFDIENDPEGKVHGKKGKTKKSNKKLRI